MPTFNNLPGKGGLHGTLNLVGAYSQNLASSASSTPITTIFNNTVTNDDNYIYKASTSQLVVVNKFKAIIVVSMAHGNNLNGTMNRGTVSINATDVITCTGASAVGFYVADLKLGDLIAGTFQKTDTNQHATFKIMIFEIL